MSEINLSSVNNLPKELDPDPLLTSVVEIRFNSKINADKLPGLVFAEFIGTLPNVKTNDLPKQVRNLNESTRHLPEYILHNSQYSFAFGPRSVLIEIIGKYPLWENYFAFIKDHLLRFFALGIVENISRIGVRYASIFDKQFDLSSALTYVPSIEISGYADSFSSFRTSFKKEKINITLLIANNAQASKDGKKFSGLLLDIDSYYSEKAQPGPNILEIIDMLHSEEKSLFYALLTPTFLTTLKPRYV